MSRITAFPFAVLTGLLTMMFYGSHGFFWGFSLSLVTVAMLLILRKGKV